MVCKQGSVVPKPSNPLERILRRPPVCFGNFVYIQYYSVILKVDVLETDQSFVLYYYLFFCPSTRMTGTRHKGCSYSTVQYKHITWSRHLYCYGT